MGELNYWRIIFPNCLGFQMGLAVLRRAEDPLRNMDKTRSIHLLQVFAMLFLVLAARAASPEPGAHLIEVDPSTTLVRVKARPYGINVNYLQDDDRLRPGARPLSAALSEMGVRWLRYPGGEKSDWHLWSPPPFSRPAPVATGYYKTQLSDPLDFDEFIALAKSIGAEPLVVVGYDTERTGFTKADYLRNAVEWVRYANLTRGYGVRYWEIGNENWDVLDPRTAARDVAGISRAMKSVDPSIKTGASGNGQPWWDAYLAEAPDLDFFTVSNYTGTPGGYPAYAGSDSVNLLHSASSALRALDQLRPVPASAGKSVIVAEFNSKDWSKNGWSDENDLGHALVNFENLGQLLLEPRINCGMLWTTRWMDPGKADTLFYALDNQNQLLPSGRVLAIWARYLRERMVSVTAPPGLAAFATASPNGNILNILILNKRAKAVAGSLSITGNKRYSLAGSFRFSGKNPSDTSPVWTRLNIRMDRASGLRTLALPGFSITILSLRAATKNAPLLRGK